MKPLGLRALAAANLARKPFRTAALILIAAVFTFMLYAGTLVSANLNEGLASLSARMGADVLVVPQGQGRKIENVILRASPSTFYLKQDLLDVVREVPGVQDATGQLFISSLEAQCCSVKVQLIGIDEASDFVVEPWLKKALPRALGPNEVVVGDYIFGDIGSTIRFYDRDFTIVGRLAPTGFGFDSSVFMNMQTAREVARKAIPEKAGEVDHLLSAVLVRVKPGVDPITVSDGVLDRLGLGADVNFVFASNMMSDTSAKLRNITRFLFAVAGVLGLTAALVMFIVFFFAFNEREKEFAVLRALGATKKRVMALVLTESLALGAAGTVLGVGLAALTVELFSYNIAKMIGLPYLGAGAAQIAAAVALSAAAGLLLCPLASAQTLWRIGRRDIYASLREGE